ncbi:MAG: hypothetical protein DHS20C01_30310 [marine bacterium B5-7]|nr:MAG: hypothetical protein DHS20C01_30310 [marine bacterium B5-7]
MSLSEFSSNRLVKDLNDQEVKGLYARGEVSELPDNTLVVAEDDMVNSLFIILFGRVQVFLPDSDKRVSQINLTTLDAHECFGEYAFIDGQPASASIMTMEQTTLYRISHRRLNKFIDEHVDAGHVIYRNLLSILVRRLRTSNAELDLFQPAWS